MIRLRKATSLNCCSKDTQGGGLRRSTKVELGTGVLPDVKKNRAAQPYQNSEQYSSLPGKKKLHGSMNRSLPFDCQTGATCVEFEQHSFDNDQRALSQKKGRKICAFEK